MKRMSILNKKRLASAKQESDSYVTFGDISINLAFCDTVTLESHSLNGSRCNIQLNTSDGTSHHAFTNISKANGRSILAAFTAWRNGIFDACKLDAELAAITQEADAEVEVSRPQNVRTPESGSKPLFVFGRSEQ